ncbi:MAG: hypothetical protein HY554_12405 [Elusimicrobia bacterium]|nr:hypothetical protein [Elusimicrobiota bacterium]
MKNRRAATILLAALGTAACGPVQEREPNDHFSQATPARAGRAVEGRLGAASDIDWYRLSSRREGTLSVRLGGIRDVDWVLAVHGPDRAELKRVDDTTVGGDEQALDVFLGPGEHYVVVANKNAKAANPRQAYRLDLLLEPGAGREREPNDRALAATPLEPGSPMRGRFHPAADPRAEGEGFEEDWFRVTVSKPGLQVLNVDVSEVPRVDSVLEVYDANAYKVRQVDAGGPGEAESLRNLGVRGPAVYSLRLFSKGRTANAEVFYQLVTELGAYQGRAEFEPNDQRLEATPLEAPSITGSLSPAGDSDWYRVAASTDTRKLLRAELTALPGMDLQLAVMDEVGNRLVLADNMGREQPEALTGFGARSEQYLVVSEKSGRKADPRQAYTLTRELSDWQPGLEYELNDSSAAPQALKTGDSVDGYFAPKGDVDWYEFNVYQKGVAALELTGVVNVRPTLALFDQEYRELKAAAASKPGEPASLEAELEPGTYAARLAPAEPEQNNVRDKYTFRVRMR